MPGTTGVFDGAPEERAYSTAPNGDRWSLVREPASERVFIEHEPNVSSGGQTTHIEIGDFLVRGGHGPEHQALLRRHCQVEALQRRLGATGLGLMPRWSRYAIALSLLIGRCEASTGRRDGAGG